MYFGKLELQNMLWVFSKENEKLEDISPLMLNGPNSSNEKLKKKEKKKEKTKTKKKKQGRMPSFVLNYSPIVLKATPCSKSQP